MNRHAIPTCLILSALLGAAPLAPAHAGATINKCVDGAGRVTLTDQACDAHTVSSTVATPGAPDGVDVAENAPRSGALPVRPARRLATAPHAALAGDMATLKQARMQLLLQDAAPRTRLAALER